MFSSINEREKVGRGEEGGMHREDRGEEGEGDEDLKMFLIPLEISSVSFWVLLSS